jgi:hypothetical protein
MDRPPPGWIPPLETSTRPDQPSLRVWSGRRVWLWLLLVVLVAGLIAAGRAGGWLDHGGLVRWELDVWVLSVPFDRAADDVAGMTGDRREGS